ncbi:TonB-dependent receptor [Paucibacter sp. R3-3]|uniref:TonB-dependent receptor n=1 Tax=Roseateles agri TaxID=3098619 RepID=A0ABU5DJR3_9BURK|nr:TonB-dependent receptor [Paucibacter sp. R3-3]MDY0745950.1 TonB-dependent receptor [Paucibacter sp. R3-3]
MFDKSLIAAACLIVLSGQSLAQQTDSSVLDTVVVTSQKRTEEARKVPLSVSAISGESLKENQILDVGDLTRNVPNISFSGQSGSGPGLSNIEIRGVSSQAGSATVGVYLDDVSLTTRNLYSQGTAEPRFFDLERVEVLRGPQGTLYGAGSMGGTLRFISKQPDLKLFSGDVSAEMSSTSHGGTNWTAQGVLNVPLATGTAALRIGVQTGHDSGYIDQVDPQSLKVIDKGINSNDWSVLRLSAKVKFNNDWSLTPALFYQHNKSHDIDAAYLTVGDYQQYNAGVPLARFQTSKIVQEPGDDKLTVPSLTLNGDLGFADFTGVVNGYKRKFNRIQDGTSVNSSYIGSLITNTAVADVVSYLPSDVYLNNKIDQVSVELRLASKDWTPGNGLPLTWVAGFFSATTKTDVVDSEPVFGITKAFTDKGADINDLSNWSDDSGMYAGAFPNDNSYYSARHYKTKQNSVFGELTWHFSPALRFTAGLRYLRSSENFRREGDFFFAGGPSTTQIDSKANKATPRFALSWDVSEDTSLYANVAEGFRLGGANRPIPIYAGTLADLATLGLTEAPATFKPDTLRSYEIGSKSRLLGGKVLLDLSAYHIDWKNIQQDVGLPTTGFDFETNVGRATSDGLEIDLKARVTPSLTVSAGGGYNRAVFAENVPALGTDDDGNLNVRKGDRIQGVPRYSLHLGGEYRFALAGIDSVVRLNGQWTGDSHGSLFRGDTDYKRPGYFTADASWGMNFEKFDLNLFVKNLGNNHTVLQQPNVQYVTEAFYLRPRTIGATLSASF